MKIMEKKELKGVGSNTAVHCNTEELANEVLRLAHEKGYSWNCGTVDFLSESNWHCYEQETCYNILDGKYSGRQFYLEDGYKLITAKEFIKLNKEDIMKEQTYTVTREQLKEVYDSCDDNCRIVIQKIAEDNLGSFGTETELSLGIVNFIRSKECNLPEELANRIFPLPKKIVTKTVVKYDSFSGKDFSSGTCHNMCNRVEDVKVNDYYPCVAKITIEYEVEE